MPLVKIKDFNILVDNKPFFDQLVKRKQAYEKLIEMSRTVKLLDYLHQENYYKLIGIDLLKQTTTSIPQQINFVAKLEENDCGTMSFIPAKQQKLL